MRYCKVTSRLVSLLYQSGCEDTMVGELTRLRAGGQTARMHWWCFQMLRLRAWRSQALQLLVGSG